MSYRNTAAAIKFSQNTGLCPVCRKKPSGTWPDGSPHITCGDRYCFYMWVTGNPPMTVAEWRAKRNRELNY